MTTITFITKTCSACGEQGRFPELGVRGFMEPEDLDTRPGGALRSSIYIWVQCCQSCGYCAPDITAGGASARTIITTEAYRRALNDPKLPDALNHCVCWSMIQENQGDWASAGWAALYAAWVCDDDPSCRKLAAHYRKEAYRLFTKAQSEGMRFGQNKSGEEIIKIDLLRRSGEFEEASRLCGKILDRQLDERTKTIVQFLRDRSDENDTRRHTLREALEELE